ncbi:MAG: nucleotidyl transferase AbiEii/AbiGii toxin family protein [Candidatus Sumerlaeia bacterium]|nr:nucleotidyl transferase AbiEii/AbiGii toxin family protein [Candidatus Sumerlaeia bacterium]
MFEQVLGEPTQSLLAGLSGLSEMRSFYLGGGTALALHWGHRRSEDLDWFSSTEFDPSSLARRLGELGPIRATKVTAASWTGMVAGVEVGFYHYPYLVLAPFESFRGLLVGSPQDILCMKLAAIASRAAKRDYVDIFFGLKTGVSLRTLLDWMAKKYSNADYSEYHLVRSLVYFDEVEEQPMPEMLQSADWMHIRSFLQDEVRKLRIV